MVVCTMSLHTSLPLLSSNHPIEISVFPFSVILWDLAYAWNLFNLILSHCAPLQTSFGGISHCIKCLLYCSKIEKTCTITFVKSERINKIMKSSVFCVGATICVVNVLKLKIIFPNFHNYRTKLQSASFSENVCEHAQTAWYKISDRSVQITVHLSAPRDTNTNDP